MDDSGRLLTRRRAATQRRLVEAAYEVFSELGLRDAPIEVICERAGFTRGAFYSNFATKEDLFLALYSQQMAERVERLKAAVGEAVREVDPTDVDAIVRHAGEQFVRSLGSDATWYLLCLEFRSQAIRTPRLREALLAAENEVLDALGAILVELLQLIGQQPRMGTRDLTLVVVSLYQSMLERAVLEDAPSPRHITEVLPMLLPSLIEPR